MREKISGTSDNAPTESWFGGFKNERIYGERFETRGEMRTMAFGFLQQETAALDVGLQVNDAVHDWSNAQQLEKLVA